MESKMILRKWTGVIRASDRESYVEYVLATGVGDYEKTPGNLGYQLLLRDRGDGTAEVTTLSWWSSMDAVRAFAGPEAEIARYYPEDDRYLMARPKFVEHHDVMAGHVAAALD